MFCESIQLKQQLVFYLGSHNYVLLIEIIHNLHNETIKNKIVFKICWLMATCYMHSWDLIVVVNSDSGLKTIVYN